MRRRYREVKYREYFKEAHIVKLSSALVDPKGYIWCQEKNVRIDAVENLLLGLCDSEEYLLALGILEKFDSLELSLHILTPLRPEDVEKITTVQLGKIKIRPDGQEEYVTCG